MALSSKNFRVRNLERFGRSVVYVGGGIGDVVMHLGHFQAIARASTGNKICIACRPATAIASLFGEADFFDRVIALGDPQAANDPIPLWPTVHKFRAGGFDSIFCLKSSVRVMAAARFAGIRHRFGYVRAHDPRAWLLTHKTVVPAKTFHPRHLSKADLLLNSLSVPFDTAGARLSPAPEFTEAAKALVAGRNSIAVGLNSSVPGRQWGERYSTLVRRLAEKFNVHFVLYGGADVQELAAVVQANSGLPDDRFIDIPARGDSLAMSYAILSRCLAYVGNDSSGLNLAVFTGLPAIGLFAVTPPFTYSPLFIGVEPEQGERGITGISIDQVYRCTAGFLTKAYPHLVVG